MSELYKGKRTLVSVAEGRVIPLAQFTGANSRSHGSSGFAVLPPLWTGTFVERFTPHMVSIHAPTDGVVTATGKKLAFRTGDGIVVVVETGITEGNICRVGVKVRKGELISMIPRKMLRSNGLNGAIIVAIPDHSRVTELHIVPGACKAGRVAAFYKLRHLDHP